jgi:hypothetical protein
MLSFTREMPTNPTISTAMNGIVAAKNTAASLSSTALPRLCANPQKLLSQTCKQAEMNAQGPS